MKIKRTEPHPGVILLKFASQYDVCSTFMRVQEFYESPIRGIRGKFFTVEQFMDAYAKRQGNFTYMTDWAGFNVPGHVIDQFFSLFHDDLWEKEKLLYLRIKEQAVGSKYYVIAVFEEGSLDHELAHALYYLEDDYRKQVKAMVKAMPVVPREQIKLWLSLNYYANPLIVDETNAYLSTETDVSLIKRFGKALRPKVAEPFRRAFQERKVA